MESRRQPRWIRRLRTRWTGGLAVWHHEAYRLPLTTLEARLGLDPRRADLALYWMLHEGVVREADVHRPERVSVAQLLRAHSPELLERLTRPEEIGRIFGVDAWDVDVDKVMDALRYSCGGTLGAARMALRERRPVFNLLGGFHHAGRDRAGGHCALNDMAVAAMVLRGEGFTGKIAVLDLDAHPPDGTVDALGADPEVWVGSLSGADWGPLHAAAATVDEGVLPEGTTDPAYLDALDALLTRMPRADLTFVLAGGDVLAADRFGKLALTLAGVRERDRRVARELRGRAAVWLPAGGYRPDAWKVLVGSAMAVAWDDPTPIPVNADPLALRFSSLAASLPAARLGGEGSDMTDLEVDLGLRRHAPGRFLGFYSAAGIELALHAYGILDVLERLGYGGFYVRTDQNDLGERFRLYGTAEAPAAPPPDGDLPPDHLLVEAVLDRVRVDGRQVLYVHWLTLRHPLGAFRAGRAPLPGQEVPGLGLAREAGELLARIAGRLGLAGVALRPSHYHVAYAARYRCQFADPERQGRFEAMLRDLAVHNAGDVSRALAEGRVDMLGAPYAWEPDLMVEWVEEAPEAPDRAARVAAERDRVAFGIRQRPAS